MLFWFRGIRFDRCGRRGGQKRQTIHSVEHPIDTAHRSDGLRRYFDRPDANGPLLPAGQGNAFGLRLPATRSHMGRLDRHHRFHLWFDGQVTTH